MKRHILIISGQWGRPRKKRQWNHLTARLLTVQVSPRWEFLSPTKAERYPACQDPCCMGGTLGRRQHQQGRGGWQWRPWWNQGHDWGIHSARAVKEAQQEEKCCYHCSSPEHFIHNCPLVKASRTDPHLNQKEGTVLKKGVWTPPGKATMPKAPQDRITMA